jgi:hypothetical protein
MPSSGGAEGITPKQLSADNFKNPQLYIDYLLEQYPEIRKLVSFGMDFIADGSLADINGAQCIQIDLGEYDEGFQSFELYAVGLDGSIYKFDSGTNKWYLPGYALNSPGESFTALVMLDEYEYEEGVVYGATAQFLIKKMLVLYLPQDRELMIRHGVDPDDVENDYVVVDTDEPWITYDSVPGTVFGLIYHPYADYDGTAHDADLTLFAGTLSDGYYGEYGMLANVRTAGGKALSIEEMYTP